MSFRRFAGNTSIKREEVTHLGETTRDALVYFGVLKAGKIKWRKLPNYLNSLYENEEIMFNPEDVDRSIVSLAMKYKVIKLEGYDKNKDRREQLVTISN